MISFRQISLIICLALPNVVLSNFWTLKNLSLNNNNGNIDLQLGNINIPMIEGDLSGVSYRCKSSQAVYPLHRCSSGVVSFIYQGTDYELRVSGWINLQLGKWKFDISDKSTKINIHLDSSQKDKIKITIDQIEMADLAKFINQFLTIDEGVSTGILSAEFDIDFNDFLEINANYSIDTLSWESKVEDYILDSTSHQGNLNLIQAQSGLVLTVNNHLTEGEGLFKDIYVLFDENPISTKAVVNFDGALQPIDTILTVHSTQDIEFQIVLDDWYEYDLKINYTIKNLNKFYQGFLVSYFEILGVNDLVVSGLSNGLISVKHGKISQANLVLDNIDIGMQSKKILFENIKARLNWESSGDLRTSEVSWDKLLLAGMPINQSKINLSSSGQQLILEGNTKLPIFDGSILIHELSLQGLFEDQINIDFDGELEPISIALITEKMGWPKMQGTISGKIPAMKKVGHSIRFDGSLDLNVFDGNMQINNLSTERLFGIAPVIAADINFKQLNIQQITSTFDFGEITGLIDGYVKGLRITNWKADRMDAQIHSVKSKSVKQTISQRAIDNISSIGGVQGALSRSFLRFFDYFKYKNIGIGCKLRNSICEMSGIQSTNNTYQIIEGKGIPSININGFRRFIDWEIFLDRLFNAGYY